MTRMAELITTKVRQLAGLKRRSDGIALGDTRMKSEGDRQRANAREAASHRASDRSRH